MAGIWWLGRGHLALCPLPVLRALIQDLVGVGLMDPKGETTWGVSRGLNTTL